MKLSDFTKAELIEGIKRVHFVRFYGDVEKSIIWECANQKIRKLSIKQEAISRKQFDNLNEYATIAKRYEGKKLGDMPLETVKKLAKLRDEYATMDAEDVRLEEEYKRLNKELDNFIKRA